MRIITNETGLSIGGVKVPTSTKDVIKAADTNAKTIKKDVTKATTKAKSISAKGGSISFGGLKVNIPPTAKIIPKIYPPKIPTTIQGAVNTAGNFVQQTAQQIASAHVDTAKSALQEVEALYTRANPALIGMQTQNILKGGMANIGALGNLAGIKDLDKSTILFRALSGDLDLSNPDDIRAAVVGTLMTGGIDPAFLAGNRALIVPVASVAVSALLLDAGIPVPPSLTAKGINAYIDVLNGKAPDLSTFNSNDALALSGALIATGSQTGALSPQASAQATSTMEDLKYYGAGYDKVIKIKEQVAAINMTKPTPPPYGGKGQVYIVPGPATLPAQPVAYPTPPTIAVGTVPQAGAPAVDYSLIPGIEAPAPAAETAPTDAPAPAAETTPAGAPAENFFDKLKRGDTKAIATVAGPLIGLAALAMIFRK